MGVTRSRLLYFKLSAFLFCFFSTPLWCDWTEDFMQEGLYLMQTLPSLDSQSDKYLAELDRFALFRSNIESSGFPEEFSSLSRTDKVHYFGNGYVLKKRPNQNIAEAFFWELSMLLGLDEYVTPSFPLLLGDHLAIVQPFEEFEFGSWVVNLPRQKTDLVSLREYTYAHLLAFLLGAQDLSGMNIGVNSQNQIRLFDNEDVFYVEPVPRKTSRSFLVSFVSVAFDWSQYRQPLEADLARELTEFCHHLRSKRAELQMYATIRGLSQETIEGIFSRMELLEAFEFQESSTFLDLLEFIYPQLSGSLDELSAIVGDILHRRVDHGIALFFATRMVKRERLTDQQMQRLDRWILQYVERG